MRLGLPILRIGGRFVGASHEPFEVIRRLRQSDLEAIAAVPHPVATIGKTSGSIARHMGEGRHHQTCAWTRDAALHRNQGEVADLVTHARICLRLGARDQIPVRSLSNVLE